MDLRAASSGTGVFVRKAVGIEPVANDSYVLHPGRATAAKVSMGPKGGMVLIADYMRQDHPLMRAMFRATVQLLDGLPDTQPSADGAVEKLLGEIFASAELLAQIHTATGTISLWRGSKKGM